MKSAGWQIRLYEEVEAAQRRTIQWGVHDCLQFVARCVEVQTGENPAADFPAYATEEEANALLAARGGVAGILTSKFGPARAPHEAGTGSIVTARLPDLMGGICLGTSCAFATRSGLLIARRLVIIDTWLVE